MTAVTSARAANSANSATGRRPDGLAAVGYLALLTVCTVFSVVWLAIGAVVAVATYWPAAAAGLAASAEGGSGWARGVLAATGRSEPLGQAVLDYALSALNLGLAVVLLVRGRRSWVPRLLAVAMIGSAGAFNLQAHGATVAVETAVGLAIGEVHQVQLHGVACAAYIVALLLFPTGRWERGPDSGAGRLLVVLAGVGALLVVGVGTALLPHTVSCILFFGFAVPLVGLAVLPRRTRYGATAELRTQARLLFSVLLAAFGTIVVLGLITFLLRYLGQPGLVLVDPTSGAAAGQPTALLFWFSRLAAVGIAGAALVATGRGGLWVAERVFSRGLASMLVAVLVGGGYVTVRAITRRLSGADGAWATVLAVALASVAFLPLYLRVERVVERLLYGTRPTPYRVLADVAALSRSGSAGGPNLAGVAESIGRLLGARSCRLTVLRPGLRDRTYAWAEGGGAGWVDEESRGDDHLVLPIRQGSEQIGTIAVDRGAVAGLHNERRHLLEDVADSLGAILQATRLGIELERQLRAALAHAEEIAVSRRQAVAEMDNERRTIERDLHDGAQHHLVTLRLAMGLVEHEVAGGELARAGDRLGQLATQLDAAAEVLAKTATGVSSIVLSEHGLVAALRADLAGADPPVVLDEGGTLSGRRLAPEIEAAVYFCCLESVNNARKHAPGAGVAVRISAKDAVLRFTIRDEGPGFTPGADSGSPGRGLRNLTARIAAVGGTITVESSVGAGTTVRGSVPLPVDVTAPVTPPVISVPASVPASVPVSEPAPAPAAVGPGGSALLDQVRGVVRTARELCAGRPESARLDELAALLDAPLRVGVVGPAGAGTSTLVTALRSPTSRSMSVLDNPALEPAGSAAGWPFDALILLVRPRPADDLGLFEALRRHRSVPTIGVLARADETCAGRPDAWEDARRAAREYLEDPLVRRVCPTVVPVAGLLAAAGATLRDDEYRSLHELSKRAEDEDRPARRELRERFGQFGVRLAVELVRDGKAATPSQLSDELVRLSGLSRLRDLMATRFVLRADTLKARSAMLALEALIRASPLSAERTHRVLYQLEQLRSGAHELAEIELVDALTAGELSLTAADHRAAEQLLGIMDGEPMARLGLTADAGPDEVHRAAGRALAHWQRLASHPAATRTVRSAAEVLVRTCERLLADTTADAATRAPGEPAGSGPSSGATGAGNG